MSKPFKVFITYSHKNTAEKDELITCLALLKSEGLISIWHDNEILPGDEWRDVIFNNLADSDLLLYLTSAHSLASANCNKELAAALKAEIKVIPIILERCDWLKHQLSDFQALPDKGNPINKWQPESDGWQNVVDGIRRVVEKMQSQANSAHKTSDETNLAARMFQRGNFLMMIDQMDMAIAAYSDVIELNSGNAFVYSNRGIAYMLKGEFDKAIADHSKAIDFKPDLAGMYNNRGAVYLRKNESNRAIKDCSVAIKLDPKYASAYINRGAAYANKGELNKAMTDFNKSIQIDPNEALAYYNRGSGYEKKDQFDKAITDYNKAIQLNPNYPAAYCNRGSVYSDKGELDKAITDYDKAIEQKHDFAEAYYNRGVAYTDKDEHDQAIADFTIAIHHKPDFAEAYCNRGNIYTDKGELDRAIADFTMAIHLNHGFAEAYYNRGNAYKQKGEHDRAIEDYNKAIRYNPGYIKAYGNRGNAYSAKGEHDHAIEDYNKAIQLEPESAIAYYNRGLTHGITSTFDAAIKDFNRAIQLKSDYAEAYGNRGVAYYQKGEVGKAIIDYTKAIELNPQFALAYCNRAEAWLHLRAWEKAKNDFTTAKRMGVDIIASFHNDYKNVETYEQRHHVKLPEDLALLLTQRRRDRYPKMQKVLGADGKPLESPNVVNLRAQLRNAGTPLGAYVKSKPSFGINTVPTEVFVVDKITRDKLIAESPSSADILKLFLHGQDLRRWHVVTPQQWLIFTYRGIVINDYPAVLKHLEKHQETLSKRKGKQAWYELPTSIDDMERFSQPKLVCPDTYNYQTFAVDTAGYYYGKTAYLIPTEEKWLCGLLNSRTVEWFYSQVSNQLTIDPLRARSGYIQQIPIPDLTPVHKALIAKIVDYLIYLQQQPTINSKDLRYARDRIMLGYFERVIDGLIYEAYLPAELHKSDKVFLQPLLDERLPLIEEIQGDKMSAIRDIFELLYDRMHLVRRHLYYLDSIKSVRIIQGKL